ncbi:DEAD/DEAH box helicase [Candidatus Pacearchaeota archaeon]|nr:DEAD/DEAH box helicase [Candidatus Pacearchaeota archaeon]
MEKFTRLGLSKELTDVLKQFGFKEPSEIQEKAIPIALVGKDIIGGSATGSGKTLAFASPILENLKPNKEIQSLILTPTRELAEQVATSIRDFSKNKNLNVLAVYGGVRIEPQMRKLSTTDVLVGTPGRIIDHINRRTLRLNNIKFLVLDEVDRMFDMGFQRDVEKIISYCPEKRQTMMFSATITQDIDYLSKKYTKNPVEISVKSYVDASKLTQVYYDVPDNKKFSLLVHLLKQEESNFVLVFCSTRRNVDFVADNLIRTGVKAKAIHGGLDQKKRLRVLAEFKKEGVGVLVCTDVAARGLDIGGVSHVYNYDIPNDTKDYIHRIGRTARAGKEGKAVNILASRDYEKFGTLMQAEEINITLEELPQIEIIRIKIDFGRSNNRFNRGSRRNDFGRSFRRNNFSRSSRRNDFSRGPRGDNRDGPRSLNRNSYNRKPNSRRYSNKRRNNFNPYTRN